ncbi:flagellar filament capping protein FliD [Alkaliphilus transvaalensis]|uniref:flagellar filament capping protein FliD n=1 Tax=Alkaliphilus transvaalensis TaxID=114628 RepID=UPI00047CD8FF|nr:flagellar filament capping protein FliD [Alkaliphilus transvaalensis]
MRIGGLASGMDTEQMVRDLMRAERMRMNKFLRQEQTLKWRQESYNDVNRVMANFILNTRKDFGITQISPNGTLRQNATNNLNWIKAANSSNEAIVSATARGDAMNGNHTVEVKQLANNAAFTSDNLITSGILKADSTFNEEFTITIQNKNGTSKEITALEGESISTFVNRINNSVIDGTEKSMGLRAAFDINLGQLMIRNRDTGEDTIVVNGLNGSTVEGTNAEIEFNGTTLVRPTNNFTVFGIELNLRSAEVDTLVNIHVDTNVDGIFNQIKSFVDSYNSMLDTLNGKVNENQYRSFQPLTQEEKDTMSDKDIELWEERAKSGLLRNDEVLIRTVQNLRGDLYKTVDASGVYKHITEIGITTGNYRDGGKLVINEDKLREAISNDPEGVMDLFFKAPASDKTGQDRVNDSGLVQRLYDGLVTGMKDVVRRSGTGDDASLLRSVQSNILIDFVTSHSSISVLDKDLMNLNTRIVREERILTQREDRYWRQFSAMEKALGQMQQQSNWLYAQMFGG